MKKTFMDGIIFFLAMNFVGIVSALGVMFFMGKLDMLKLKDMREMALGTLTTIDLERKKELETIEEEFKKIKDEEMKKSRQEGMIESGLYDKKIEALEKRENEIRLISDNLKIEKEAVEKRWQEIKSIKEEYEKEKLAYETKKKEDFEKTKDQRLQNLLKRYDNMEPVNVAKALLNTKEDPKVSPPIPPKESTDPGDDPRIKDVAFYLQQMKPTRAAEILETMGPEWTYYLQKQMVNTPIPNEK